MTDDTQTTGLEPASTSTTSAPEYWWLSFADGKLPEGEQFLGALVVPAPSFLLAITVANLAAVNPGGEVLGAPFPPEVAAIVQPDHVLRLMTREECEAFDLWVAERLSPPELRS